MSKTVRINKNVDAKLTEISKKRKSEGHAIYTKASILHDLILRLHKREIGNEK